MNIMFFKRWPSKQIGLELGGRHITPDLGLKIFKNLVLFQGCRPPVKLYKVRKIKNGQEK